MIDLFCATMVVGTFFWLAYLFGEHIAKWAKTAEVWFTILAVLALAVVGIYFWRRHVKKKVMPAKLNPCNDPPLNSHRSDSNFPPNQKTANSAHLTSQTDKAGN